MAVVTKYSAAIKDPSSTLLPKSVFAAGALVGLVTKTIAVANGDSSGTKHYLGRVSSSAVPLYAPSTLLHTGITGVTSYKIGLERGGSTVDDDIFSGTLNVTSAGSKNPFAALDSTTLGKQVWELLGLSNDPGLEYDIVAVTGADAGAAGTLSVQMLFVTP